ncbi:MAG: M6 family metalloprotease domain-containing protein, partial [Desulfuromonadales bacterium]|nr:M6 family metalloprotease domain-containing protein [Desulfuromonadales bacterium]
MRKRIFLMLIITFALCSSLYAAPALPRFMEITQPDGSIITARQQGDEFQHWTETKKGYTILRNPRTKYWEYAEQDANGRLRSSGYRALGQEFVPSHIPPQLKPPRNKKLELYRQKSLNQTYQERRKGTALPPSSSPFAPSPSVQRAAVGDWTPMPVAGERKVLLVLINFSNRNLVTTPAQWESTLFSPTDKSVARYFAENSFSALSVKPAEHNQSGSPAGVITVSIATPHPYPNGDRDPNESYATEPGILNLALTQAATDVDFSSFDADNSGTLEQSELVIYFIYAGYEASESNKIPSVWAHAWGEPGVTAGGVAVTDWAISGELNNAGRQQTMGIIAHELGHALCGLPDLYDTSYTNAGMGIFSLMAAGSWG